MVAVASTGPGRRRHHGWQAIRLAPERRWSPRSAPVVTVLAASAAAALGGLAVGAVSGALDRQVERRERHRDRPSARRSAEAATTEAEERERAVLDLLASDDPARLVVFTLRRARGYAAQSRGHDRAGRGTTLAGRRRRRAAELARLEAALDGFRVSGVPADDLLAVRRLERRAYRLAASTRAQRPAPPP